MISRSSLHARVVNPSRITLLKPFTVDGSLGDRGGSGRNVLTRASSRMNDAPGDAPNYRIPVLVFD